MTSPKSTFKDKGPMQALIDRAYADKKAAKEGARPLSLRTMDQIASMWSETHRNEYSALKDQLRVALYARALKDYEWSKAYELVIKDAPMPEILPENPMLFSDGIAILKTMAHGNTGFQTLLHHVKAAELSEEMLLAEPLALKDLGRQMLEGNDRAAAHILKYATDMRRGSKAVTPDAGAVTHTTNNVVMVATDESGVMRLEPPKPKVLQAEVVSVREGVES